MVYEKPEVLSFTLEELEELRTGWTCTEVSTVYYYCSNIHGNQCSHGLNYTPSGCLNGGVYVHQCKKYPV